MQVMQGQAAVGKIVLQTTSSVAEVRTLNSVQATLALLAKSDDIATDSNSGVKQIGVRSRTDSGHLSAACLELAWRIITVYSSVSMVQKLLVNADWTSALQLWAGHAVHPIDENAITFRGSCVRDGKHAYKSVDVAGEVGARVVEKFGWGVSLNDFDLEVVVVLFYKFMVAGISLADPRKIQFRNRLANEDRSALADAQYISTLRPSTAYLMLQLAQHKLGDVCLDSMCGIGTLPICCADFTGDRVFALGGELDEIPVGKAGQNARTRVRPVDMARWDSTRLPLRSNSIDRILIDMPFGLRCGNQRLNNKELLRVLRPDGRAVLLVMSKKLFRGAIKDLPLRVVAAHMVSIGGLGGGIYVVEPSTDSEASEPKTAAAEGTIGQKRAASSICA
ncbi:hypothetical protein BBJ28_00005371 [Nothophytophthora sp. Chile5]|nr:hypothetical protein BBJ28_00005371 [Nothophytophthora sp. Chile5]